MRKLIFAALLTAAPLLALGSTPAAACWGFGYGYSASYAPRTYSYAPRARSYGYAPAYSYYGAGGTMAGPSIGAASCVVRPGVQGVGGGERLSLTNQIQGAETA